MKRYRLAIADDHPVVMLGLRESLRGSASIEIIGEATTGAGALDLCRRERPDVLVLDVKLPDVRGVEVFRALQANADAPRVLFISGSASTTDLLLLRGAGATSFILKGAAPEKLVQAVVTVAAGGTYVDPNVAPILAETSPTLLSARELEIVSLLRTGGSNKELAEQLGISPETVRTHLANVYAKLGVADRTEALAYCLRHGLIEL